MLEFAPSQLFQFGGNSSAQNPFSNCSNVVQRPTSVEIIPEYPSFSSLYAWLGIREKKTSHKRKSRQEDNIAYAPSFQNVEQIEVAAFADLLCDKKVLKLLLFDRCCKIADKYLIAMVFLYFKRANLLPFEYTYVNFFLALYLAHDVEEDEDMWKEDILPFAIGPKWRYERLNFLIERDRLWKRMQYRAHVSCRSCEAVFRVVLPGHEVWQRNRPIHHSYALRLHDRDPSEFEAIDLYSDFDRI